jgi:hypothetical protein
MFIVWAVYALVNDHGNITCKKQVGSQYELCVNNHPVYVPYSVYRNARVGEDYSKSNGRVTVSEHEGGFSGHGGVGHGVGHGGGGGK